MKNGLVTKDDNKSRRCDFCDIVVHRSLYAKLLRNKKLWKVKNIWK